MGYVLRMRTKKTLYNGTSCTGADGAVNRTLVHTKALASDAQVIVGKATLMDTDEYTVSGATITFLIPIDNTDRIMVIA
jgi:hypothetical protein